MNELGDNGAHVASITVFVNAPPLYLLHEGTPLQTQGLPRCLVPLPREHGQQVMFFSGIFMSLPQ